MKKRILAELPWIDELSKRINGIPLPPVRNANCHIHSPYSFSSFDSLDTAFSMARDENISVLGINDFFVSDGYDDFMEGCSDNCIFPLLNIEFIGLMKAEQKKGVRINDPNNPGRIYFCGKGLDYPFNPGFFNSILLKKTISRSQVQMKEMTEKLNALINNIDPSLSLEYGTIKREFAKELVRERHLAKAVRHLAFKNYKTTEERLQFIEKLYGGKKSGTGIENAAALENEIRSRLLKAGGTAFVEEDERAFPDLSRIISIIIKAGGIPCYPVLLDDASGSFTEFEHDREKLFQSLSNLGVGCIELIPGRNSPAILNDFVKFFHDKNFIILFGTEHNTPELLPLKVTARGGGELNEFLLKTAWEGACLVAAHQYLRAHGRQGYVLDNGKPSTDQKTELTRLGKMVIEYFLNKNKYEG